MQAGQLPEGIIVDPLHYARLLQQQLSGGGERHAAGMSDQQGRAQTLLKFFHVVCQRWLAESHLPGCQTDIFVGGYCNKLS